MEANEKHFEGGGPSGIERQSKIIRECGFRMLTAMVRICEQLYQERGAV